MIHSCSCLKLALQGYKLILITVRWLSGPSWGRDKIGQFGVDLRAAAVGGEGDGGVGHGGWRRSEGGGPRGFWALPA